MSRLIDADKLIEDIKINDIGDRIGDSQIDIIKAINRQPIAYDVDKVVEQLEVRKEVYYEKFEDHRRGNNKEIAKNYLNKFNMVDNIVRIVKAGEIDD